MQYTLAVPANTTRREMKQYLDDEVVLDRMIAALVDRPRTYTELFSAAVGVDEPMPTLEQADEALDILFAANAIKEFKETRYGDRMRIFALKSEARTYLLCDLCRGTGVQADQKRGLCPICHGNGMVTPVWKHGDD
jgi:hypothetical protein